MRKRVELGEAIEVRRIRSISGAEATPRRNAHRTGLEEGDWDSLLRERRAFLSKPRPVAAQPAVLRPLTLPLYVTRYLASVRHWPRLEQLLVEINQLFAPVQIVFQLTEPAECNRSVGVRGSICPFSDDLDHEYEWLHLGLVTKLAGDQPVLPGCGRCCLVPDRSGAADVARALALQLGVPEARFGPEGIELEPEQVQWMRWQSWLLLGQLVPLPRLSVPVHAFSLPTSQRSETELAQLLERVNRIWQQAAVELQLVRWSPSAENEPQADDPQAIRLLCDNSGELQVDPPGRLLRLPDGGADLERSLARALGKLLGLADVAGADQLMFSAARGTRLSIPEISQARAACSSEIDQTWQQLQLSSLQRSFPAAAEVRNVEIQLILVRGPRQAARQTLAEAEEWRQRVNCILGHAGIRLQGPILEAHLDEPGLQAAYPNPPGTLPSTRKASCAALQKLPTYRSSCLNVLVVHELPQAAKVPALSAYTSWPGARILLVAEHFPSHSLDKQLAQALVVFWGLRPSPKAEAGSLLSWRGGGLRLSPEEAAALQAEPAPAAVAVGATPSLPLLTIPVQLVHSSDLSPALARARVEQANFKAAAGGLRWEVQASAVDPGGDFPHYHPQRLNLYLRSGTPTRCLRDQRILETGGDVYEALTQFLHLTSTLGARAQAQHLLEALDPGQPGAPPAPLALPIKVLRVTNPELASRHSFPLPQALEVAGIQLQLRGTQEVQLNPLAWQNALPSKSGDRERQPSCAGLVGTPGYDIGALNLFLVGQLTSVDGAQHYLSTQDRARKILIMRDHDEQLSGERLLIRALLTFLELPPHDFAGPDSLRGGGNGLTPREIERARGEVSRLFPALFQLPSIQLPRLSG